MLLNGADVLRAFGTPEAMRPILRNGTPTEGPSAARIIAGQDSAAALMK